MLIEGSAKEAVQHVISAFKLQILHDLLNSDLSFFHYDLCKDLHGFLKRPIKLVEAFKLSMPTQQITVEVPTTVMEARAMVVMPVVAVATVYVAVAVQEDETTAVEAAVTIETPTLALMATIQKKMIYLYASGSHADATCYVIYSRILPSLIGMREGIST